MKALDRKLLRDLRLARGQAAAVALVIASGVATYVLFASTLTSLHRTRDAFYRDGRFADLFVSLSRAPESLASRLAEVPGVVRAETRVVAAGRLEVEGFTEPVSGRIVSIPDDGEPVLNRLYIRKGRRPDPSRPDEIVVGESFAEAHALAPGDRIAAVLSGRRKVLEIVGIGFSPEYVYQIDPGSGFPDFKRFGVLWMARTPLAAAYDMEGAFNDAALALGHGASEKDVIARVDARLAPYGGVGAIARADQTSHRYLSEEFRQLGSMATIFPAIFLAVSAFLINIVLARQVATQREQIAALKAFGYGNRAVALHYLKFVAVVVIAGTAGGILLGAWFGSRMSRLYAAFYRFPFLVFRVPAAVMAKGLLVTGAAAAVGTLRAVQKAVRLAPAEGMRPDAPAVYRRTLLERFVLGRFIGYPTRMVLRHIARRPVTALLSVAGIALAVAIMMTGRFSEDSIDYMVEVTHGLAQREDLTVAFTEPASRRSLFEIERLPGVTRAEPFRVVPVRLRKGHLERRTALQGLENGGDLQRLLDARLRIVALPPEGIVLGEYLAGRLGAFPGETVEVEVLEGTRPLLRLPVAATVHEFVGIPAYMELAALNRALGEGNAISGAWVAVDGARAAEAYRSLQARPRVATIVSRKAAIRNFDEAMEGTILFFTFVATLLAATIAFGVVYNTSRITLGERSRELASLRVLGYTRGEAAYILLGEIVLLALAAIPPGFLAGRALCAFIAASLQSDLYRVPVVLTPATHAMAAASVLAATLVSAVAAGRRVNRLDLVGVLKARE